MTVELPKLTEEQEELLLVVAVEAARSIPPGPVRIDPLSDLVERTGKECRAVLREIRALGLVEILDAGGGKSLLDSVSLTDLGKEAAHQLALGEAKGPVAEFCEGLSPLQLTVLDTVTEHESRAAGSSITRSQLRVAVRNTVGSGLTLEQADESITSLAPRFLTVGPAPGSSAKVTAAGLLASKWGTNAVETIDGLFGLLRDALRKNAVVRQYGWRQVRRGLSLPRKAHDLFYVTVTRCGVGSGIFQHSGDDWWTVPDNLDEILEEPSALSFLRKATQPPPPVPAATGTNEARVSGSAAPRPAQGADMTTSQPDPKKVFIIHGRNVAARNAVEQFVRSLGLQPLDFDQVSADLGGSPFVGEVVRRGMELAQGIIALFTPDEFSALRPSFLGAAEKPDDVQRWQSRPNVIFEAGMAYGMTPKRAVLVTLGAEVALFSDVAGIHLVRLDNNVENRKKLRQKLIGMKCSVDERADAWTDPTRSGDFETCIKALPEVSTRSPFGDTSGAPTGNEERDAAGTAPHGEIPLGNQAAEVMRWLAQRYVEAGYPNFKVWMFTPNDQDDPTYGELRALGLVYFGGPRGGPWRLTEKGVEWIMRHRSA